MRIDGKVKVRFGDIWLWELFEGPFGQWSERNGVVTRFGSPHLSLEAQSLTTVDGKPEQDADVFEALASS